MRLQELNTKSKEDFLDVIGGPLEGEVWLAERVIALRPFADTDALITAFETVISTASQDEKVRIIASHPDLAPKMGTALSEASQSEQASAGLTQLTPTEHAQFTTLNTRYRARFGFPFVICARNHDKSSILQHFESRLAHERDDEIEIGVGEVLKIIRLRIIDLISSSEI